MCARIIATSVLEVIPFLTQKIKAVFKIFHDAEFCGKIVARKP
jgi:hypothetical protein